MPTSKYEVMSLTIEELLSPDTAEFEVPPFQRTYSWGADEINQLIDDLFGDSSDPDLPYFLGSVVLATREDSNDSRRSLILDGQQRLTTISLLIAVLINKLSEHGTMDVAMLKSRLFSYGVDMQPRPKLLLQGEDRTVFGALLKEPFRYSERNYRTTRLGSGLTKIHQAIEKYADQGSSGNGLAIAYRQMLMRLLREVEIVRITAPSEKDAFRLFETLNDRGLALSAADLIKNKLFSQCGPEIDDAIEAWSNIVTLTRDDNIVNFLRYYWIAAHGFVRKQRLYDRHRTYISELNAREAGELALNLYVSAEDYHRIVTPLADAKSKDLEVIRALERLNVYRARSCRPAIMACNMFKHRQEDRARLIALCESITVRYSIVGEKPPNLLEIIYSEMCTALRNSDMTLENLFYAEPLFSRMQEVPHDEDFVDKLQRMIIPSVTPVWREILSRINTELGTGETKPEGPDLVHVDHILPQNPRPTILVESGLTKEEASTLAFRIGNFTLLSKKLNQQASNKPFSQKRDENYSLSEFAMTKQLLQYEKWGQEEIETRSRDFAHRVAKIYPHPLDIV
jgi:uncharacterized protein DUF262/uncharacterized protein DUF1524